MIFEMSVYDNKRWTLQGKREYIVKGSARDLMGYVKRLMAKDEATGDPMEYHVFDIDPRGDWGRYDWDMALNDPDFEALDRLIHPAYYETCQHGMCLASCYGPGHYAD
jgi:hypothetical protein